MVNGGFPAISRYGFEMVDGRDAAALASIKNLHRIKSVNFFANFSRFNFNANTCDLSTAVNHQSSAMKATERERQPE
jgi:hypothetical protein